MKRCKNSPLSRKARPYSLWGRTLAGSRPIREPSNSCPPSFRDEVGTHLWHPGDRVFSWFEY